MPNPSTAIAVGSYAGSLNIGVSFASPEGSRRNLNEALKTLLSWLSTRNFSEQSFPTHEIQRPKICTRFGSAARLKAGSHPIGGRDSVVTTGDETIEVCLSACGSRSPLWVRSTETPSDWLLRAAPAPATAAAKPVTVRQPTTAIKAMSLAARRLRRSAKTAVLFVSISRLPLVGD